MAQHYVVTAVASLQLHASRDVLTVDDHEAMLLVKTFTRRVPVDTALRRATWTSTAAWGAVGALWALSLLGLASIGWFVMPVALLVTVVVARHEGRRGLFGAAVGAFVVAAVLFAAAAITA